MRWRSSIARAGASPVSACFRLQNSWERTGPRCIGCRATMAEESGPASLVGRRARWGSVAAHTRSAAELCKRLLDGWRQRGPLAWLPLLASFFALRALLARAGAELGFYDEGLLFTGAQLLRQGFTVYTDFHFCYPPGILQIVRAVMALDLPPIWTVRLLAVVVRIGSAVAVGYLVGRSQDKRFCLWAFAIVLILQERLHVVLYAYPIALMLALLAILLWPMPGAPRWRGIVCGISFGCISYIRHDLFTYAVGSLAVAEGLWWALKRESLLMESARRLTDFALALVGTGLALWLPVFIQSGISRPLHDIVIDLATRIMPGRKLPVPSLLEGIRVEPLNLKLPAVLVELERFSLVLGIAAVSASILAILIGATRELRAGDVARKAALRTLLLTGAFALATVPQALRRFDTFHVTFGLPLTVAALFVAAGPRVREPLFLLAIMTWFASPPPFIDWAGAKRLWRQRADEHFVPPERLAIARYVERKIKPGEPFFSACYTHRRTMASNLDLYYLARRPAATKYIIFDPGTTNSVEGQSEMIADLERTRPKIVLRGPGCVWYEPNESLNEGATLLDEYLDQHYALDRNVGAWAVWRPRKR
ncbi:MAG: hypothetical protein ABW217_20675 [Polyangiaceae bacterium]